MGGLISPRVGRRASFASRAGCYTPEARTIWRASPPELAGVEGKYSLGGGAVVLPSAQLGHARDIAKGFRDGLGRDVKGQWAALTWLRMAATFEIPVEVAWGYLTLRPGLRFVFSDANGAA